MIAFYWSTGIDAMNIILGTLSFLGASPLIFLMQFYILWRLWGFLRDPQNNPDFCENEQIGPILQFCAVGALLISVGRSL